MAVLQVFQAKLLSCLDESGSNPVAFRELRNKTNLALRATKTTAQAIGRSMASVVVLEHYLWLTLMDIKDADKVLFFNARYPPPASSGLRSNDSQSASQIIRSRPRPCNTSYQSALALQLLLVALSLCRLSSLLSLQNPQPRGYSLSARRYPFPTCQGT